MRKVFVILSLVALVTSASWAMRIGALNTNGAGGFLNYATVGTDFNDTLTGDLGLAIGQDATGKNSNVGLLGRLEFALGKIGEVKTIAGGMLIFATNPGYAAAATSAFMLNGFVGAEYMITKNLGMVGTLTLLEIYSASGTTQLGLGSGTASGTGWGTSSWFSLYSGIRLYI
jgi:hypothetical protein